MQEAIVFLIVGGAAIYLVRQLVASLRGKSSCGSCSAGCTKPQKPTQQPELVQIDLGATWKK